MKPILALALFSAACAAGSASLDRDRAPRHAARLDLPMRSRDPDPEIPVLITARLPSADRIWKLIRDELGHAPSVDVELCIRPNGSISRATLVQGTALPEFDQAVLRDVSTWRFDRVPGPPTVQTCRRTTIKYLAT